MPVAKFFFEYVDILNTRWWVSDGGEGTPFGNTIVFLHADKEVQA